VHGNFFHGWLPVWEKKMGEQKEFFLQNGLTKQGNDDRLITRKK
jgi:hypothetical protein